jgi:hypothetical protein
MRTLGLTIGVVALGVVVAHVMAVLIIIGLIGDLLWPVCQEAKAYPTSYQKSATQERHEEIRRLREHAESVALDRKLAQKLNQRYWM